MYINSAVLYENYLKLTIDLKFDPNFSQGHNEALPWIPAKGKENEK